VILNYLFDVAKKTDGAYMFLRSLIAEPPSKKLLPDPIPGSKFLFTLS